MDFNRMVFFIYQKVIEVSVHSFVLNLFNGISNPYGLFNAEFIYKRLFEILTIFSVNFLFINNHLFTVM